VTAHGPMGYSALPTGVAAAISVSYQDKLVNHGCDWPLTALISVYADELAAPALDELGPCPADEGLRLGLGVLAEAFGEAMRKHGMYSAPIERIEQQVRQDIETLVSRQAQVHERLSGPLSRPGSEAEHRAERGGPPTWGVSQGGAS
jgi:hypothetical protein